MTDAPNGSPESLRRSVVKLFTVIKKPNYYQPWDLGYQKNSGGSACVVSGGRILTNAHVVRHQVYVQALKPGDAKKYTAKVEYVDHDSETALLSVEDPSFFEGTVPVRFGGLPPRHAEVSVHGFPVGGNELCVTKGVVSRIEVLRYTHSQRHLLALQTDAAINPGNSGGPVFAGGEFVGIAFQSHGGGDIERSGHVVPVPVIRRFLEDIEDGAVSGVPDLGIYWQKIESEGLREYVGLGSGQTGVMVTRVVHGSSADGVLREGDVLTGLDDTPVACDGSVPLREQDRVHFSYLVSRRQVGDELGVRVVREGQSLALSVRLAPSAALVRRPRHDRRPTYYIFAGLVFMPLTYDFLSVWDWKDVNPRFRHYYNEGLPSPRRKEIVIVNQVLAHDINVGYHQVRAAVVDRINGVDITEMADVPGALRAPPGKYHIIEIDYHGAPGEASDYHSAFGTRIVLDAALARRAHEEILTKYGIPSDRFGIDG